MLHHLAGQEDSTAMLLLMIERNYQIGRNILGYRYGVSGMYEHIDKVEDYIDRSATRLKQKILWRLNVRAYKNKGKNKGKKGYGWWQWARWCTTTLKQDVIKRHLRQYDIVVEYRNIALDEDKDKKNQMAGIYSIRSLSGHDRAGLLRILL